MTKAVFYQTTTATKIQILIAFIITEQYIVLKLERQSNFVNLLINFNLRHRPN